VHSGPAILIALGGVGYIVGSVSGARLNQRLLPHRVAMFGAATMLLAATALASLARTEWFVWPTLAACVMLYAMGWSLVQPWAQATALVGNEGEAGRVSALYGLVQLCGVSLLVSLIGRWLTTAVALGAVWFVVGLLLLFIVRATRADARLSIR
jgi:predicted MFS family arabinose efflux permease